MGLFDFLNPKKAITSKLSAKVEELVMGEVESRFGGVTNPKELKGKLQEFVAEKAKEQAAEYIPGPLQSAADGIIQKAAEGVTNKIYDKVASKVLSKLPGGGAH